MLISNRNERNHEKVIGQLIEKADKCILCTGWIDLPGIKKIEPYISKSKASKNEIVIYSNSNIKHTPSNVIDYLKKNKCINHWIVDDSYRRLHSKIYYFESGSKFDAIIGSANLTHNGLTKNEELSIHVTGNIGSTKHIEIIEYLSSLNVVLQRNA
ncbi:MAG: phospholipase D family protein [Flavobacteriales bacterium]|nr:phospholipase D family protein [Flavobacteriales bacterium]